jgi:hypothetical protein
MPSVLISGQRPEVDLRRALEEQFVAESLRGLLRGSAFREREVGQFVEAGGLSERRHCKCAHCQHANESGLRESSRAFGFHSCRLLASDKFTHFNSSMVGGCHVASRMALSAQ